MPESCLRHICAATFAFLWVSVLVGQGAEAKDPEPGGTSSHVVTKGNEYGDDGQPLAALTFDDGPHPELTPRLLEILSDTSTTATFYVVGRAVHSQPELVRMIRAGGHEIGNHTWSHPDLRKLSPTAIGSELAKTSSIVRDSTGEAPYGMRPPYGAFNRKVLDAITEASPGSPVVLWTVDPQDWKRPGAGVVAERVLNQISPGAIVLLHDIHPGTIQAVPRIIDGLRRKGYRLVTVSEILRTRQSLDLDSE